MNPLIEKTIAVFVGTRPEIIKMQPIVNEIRIRKCFKLIFAHTGQHYDWNMSNSFIQELELPSPGVFLNVKSGSQGIQTARIVARAERFLKKSRPDIVVIEGDTNSAFGVSLAASKLHIPIGHVEAGCRSFDKRMPEEINRILISDLSSMQFAPTQNCVQNLVREGIPKEQIHLTGHPIVDVLNRFRGELRESAISKFGPKAKEYYLATIHREENVSNKDELERRLEAFSILSKTRSVIFPVHPRTRKCIRKFKLENHLRDLIAIEPVSYFDSLCLIKYAKIILTDSGGIQQEAALLETPCITLRDVTEWVETVNKGVNFLARSEDDVVAVAEEIEKEHDIIINRFRFLGEVFGKRGASKTIVDLLAST